MKLRARICRETILPPHFVPLSFPDLRRLLRRFCLSAERLLDAAVKAEYAFPCFAVPPLLLFFSFFLFLFFFLDRVHHANLV